MSLAEEKSLRLRIQDLESRLHSNEEKLKMYEIKLTQPDNGASSDLNKTKDLEAQVLQLRFVFNFRCILLIVS